MNKIALPTFGSVGLFVWRFCTKLAQAQIANYQSVTPLLGVGIDKYPVCALAAPSRILLSTSDNGRTSFHNLKCAYPLSAHRNELVSARSCAIGNGYLISIFPPQGVSLGSFGAQIYAGCIANGCCETIEFFTRLGCGGCLGLW